MKRKAPALRNIGIDLDPEAIDDFECTYPVKLINVCAHRFLADYDYQGSELIYSDPPYLLHTRTSARRYRFDYEEQDHVELLELLKTLPCQVILSGYPSALYDELLQGVAKHRTASHEPGRCAYRETVVQLHSGQSPLGRLRGQELHPPSTDQAQGGQLGKALRGTAPGATSGGAGGLDGR